MDILRLACWVCAFLFVCFFDATFVFLRFRIYKSNVPPVVSHPTHVAIDELHPFGVRNPIATVNGTDRDGGFVFYGIWSGNTIGEGMCESQCDILLRCDETSQCHCSRRSSKFDLTCCLHRYI